MSDIYDTLGECGTSGVNTQWRLALDAVATSDPQYGNHRDAYLLSAVGPQTSIKGVSAMLQAGNYCQIWYRLPRGVMRHGAFSGGVKVYKHRLAFDHWHMLAVSTSDLLIQNSHRALWEKLNGPRFTTPLLRSWVRELGRRLKRDKKLQPLDCHRCHMALLMLDSDELDEYVSKGIRGGVLKLEPQEAA